jgi:hypothetical protein
MNENGHWSADEEYKIEINNQLEFINNLENSLHSNDSSQYLNNMYNSILKLSKNEIFVFYFKTNQVNFTICRKQIKLIFIFKFF